MRNATAGCGRGYGICHAALVAVEVGGGEIRREESEEATRILQSRLKRVWVAEIGHRDLRTSPRPKGALGSIPHHDPDPLRRGDQRFGGRPTNVTCDSGDYQHDAPS